MPTPVRRTKRSKIGRQNTCHSPDYAPTRASIRPPVNSLVALAITLARFHPPRNFPHRPLRENPQLAAPVAVQFQNSEARLLPPHLEEWGELFQNHGNLRPAGHRIAPGGACFPPPALKRPPRPAHRNATDGARRHDHPRTSPKPTISICSDPWCGIRISSAIWPESIR